MPWSVNGIGTTYYCAADRNDDDDSFITTEWVIFAGIPLIPFRSWRVIHMGIEDEDGNSQDTYSILEQVPLKITQILWTWFLAITFGAIFAALLYGGFDFLPQRFGYAAYFSYGAIACCFIHYFIFSSFFAAR